MKDYNSMLEVILYVGKNMFLHAEDSVDYWDKAAKTMILVDQMYHSNMMNEIIKAIINEIERTLREE